MRWSVSGLGYGRLAPPCFHRGMSWHSNSEGRCRLRPLPGIKREVHEIYQLFFIGSAPLADHTTDLPKTREKGLTSSRFFLLIYRKNRFKFWKDARRIPEDERFDKILEFDQTNYRRIATKEKIDLLDCKTEVLNSELERTMDSLVLPEQHEREFIKI